MHEKFAILFWISLILYLVTLFNVSYVGVYLTYFAIPIILFFGVGMLFTKPKDRTQQLYNTKKIVEQKIHDGLSFVDQNSAIARERTRERIDLRQKMTAPYKKEKEFLLNKSNINSDNSSKILEEIRVLDKKIIEIEKSCDELINKKYK